MKYVISGGNQDEVRDVFRVKGLERYFTGIFGSPEDKITIIHDKLKSKDIQLPAIFIGDSRYDYEVAVENNFAFVFMSQYSEFKEWKKFFSDKKDVMIIKNLSSLI
jgi:phosphoglycolate phosphatase-like HAD superfamily hydrolase